MPHDPPKGEEKKIVKRLRALVQKVYGQTRIDPPYCGTCTSGHALEGVRCNGTERLTALPECLSDLKEYIQRARKFQKQWSATLEMAEREFVRIKHEIGKHLKLCHKCKGKQGSGRCGAYLSDKWYDCGYCDGRGYIGK